MEEKSLDENRCVSTYMEPIRLRRSKCTKQDTRCATLSASREVYPPREGLTISHETRHSPRMKLAS